MDVSITNSALSILIGLGYLVALAVLVLAAAALIKYVFFR